MTTRIAVVGATGRLGTQVCQIVEATPDMELVAQLDSHSDLHEMLGADIAVDVTLPGVSPHVVDFAIAQGIKVLVGTSGWSADRITALHKTVEATPGASVFIVPNFSLGSTLQTMVAKTLAEHFESIEIVETHHAGKADSPSGTAVRTAEEIAAVRRDRGGVIAPHSNQSARGEQVQGVPVHSLRLNGVLAEQDVIFGGVGESLTLSHTTHSRDAYQAGIVLALRFMLAHTGLAVGLENALGMTTS
jgi:4-hydroxy-tetrahydrodipicolinate reductase